MAKRKHRDAPEFVEELEGAAERLANWIAGHTNSSLNLYILRDEAAKLLGIEKKKR